jgi:hypothetical protein
LFEVLEGSTVIAIDASHYSEIPNRQLMDQEIGVTSTPRGLNEIRCRCLKVAGSKQAAAQIKYGTFPVARRRFVGYFRKSNARRFCLASLLLAIRLIVVPNDLKLIWQWECKDRLTDPVNHIRPMGKPRLLSNGRELVTQRPEVLS